MKFFVDTADLNEIKDLAATGMVDGVTTNPSLAAKQGMNFKELIAEVCKVVSGPVSAEVTALDYETMMKEADVLRKIARNITIKVPLTQDGLKVCRALSSEGTMVNVTLCFTCGQAILAAKAGATFVSPFVGRLDDLGVNGMQLIEDIRMVYDNYDSFKTQILVASVRSPEHIINAGRIGADVVTAPPKVIRQLYHHPLTDSGLKTFAEDWAKTGQSIL
ncbi:MAG: fructose-6-phosphate aldolase [Alphaproteobacteria bacterium]|nr:fructose-6-phosphate aldolase [Alphaproteobacteria bacterium]MBO4644636.1 fructose-6-phosphate aldolase [Alphaproteobacteria bacterium]MBR1945490.1 fructose-6-phosphate aldolase [Alphaproteobacteria bacterium]MBR4126121.1 fructose-6-phosphate aldolase [Alphaproteobacteria bacterium]